MLSFSASFSLLKISKCKFEDWLYNCDLLGMERSLRVLKFGWAQMSTLL
jgi:hypothetical protein